MKRILSLFLCVALSMTMLIVPGVTAMAEDVPNYEDYIAGVMPANMFKSATDMGSSAVWCANVDRTCTKIKRTVTNSSTGISITANGEPGGAMEGSAPVWYHTNGIYFGQDLIKSNNSSGYKGDIDDGKNYVYAMQVRNLNPTYTPNIRFYLYDLDGPAGLNAVEWGSAGMPVTSTDWMDFKGTINAPERNKSDTINDVDRISIGFNSSTLAGSSVDINLTDESEGMYALYFAEEVAYDIANNLVDGKTTVKTGDVLTFKAEVTNQVGLPGYLDQTFVWKAMDTERENEVSGISIETSDDTKTATVTIEDTLLPGSYDIVAYSEEYNMAKGCTITMEAPYYYTDSGNIVTEAKLNTSDEWISEKVSTGLVNHIEVKATLEGNTEAFEWLITDKNRLNIVEDVFDVTPITTSGAEQTVKVVAKTGVDVKPGDYNVVAVAKDGSLKAHPIALDITGDLGVIINTFVNGTTQEIEEGLKTTYLSVLGLLDSNSSKADKTALAKVISTAAVEEKIADITDVEDIRKVLERLAVLSFYNVKPEGVELMDENAHFTFEKELGIDKIDTDGVSLYTLYKTAMTEDGQANVRSAVTGKDIKAVSEFISKLKESVVINAIAYPVSNGTGYVSNILTKENMEAASIDSGNYLSADSKTKYNSAIAGKTLTIAEIETELAKTYETPSGNGGSSSNNGGGKNTSFGSDITVSTTDKEEDKKNDDVNTEIKYDDVSEKHWAFPEVVFLTKLGVINGANGKFNPEKTVTREEILKMICVAFNIKADDAQCDFADVKKDAWYYDYVASAKQNGIVNGINESEFGIGKSVTRQDICVMVMRAAQMTSDGYPEAIFTDSADVASYAKDSVNCLNALYVINGFSDGTFKPKASCTKAQAAKIISNALHILSGISE